MTFSNRPHFRLPRASTNGGAAMPTPIVYVRDDVKWEYKQLSHSLTSDELPTDDDLNELGAEGWELSGILTTSDTAHYYFKRLIQS